MQQQAETLQRTVLRRLRLTTGSAELRRGVAAGVVLYGVGVVVRTLSEVIFARLMGPHEFGAYSYIFAWLSILAVFGGLGVPYALVRFIPEYDVKRNLAAQRRLARFARWSAVVSGCGIGVISGIVIAAVSPTGVGVASIAIGMATVPILALFTAQTELARGFRRVVLAYLPFLVLRPILTVVLALGFVVGTGSLTAEQGLTAGLLAILLGLALQRTGVHRLLAARVATSDTVHSDQPDVAKRDSHKTWLRVALPLLTINALAAIAQRADVIVVGLIKGATTAGVYAVAAKVALLATFALEALNTIVAPTLSRRFHAQEYEGVQSLARNAARVTLAFSLGATLILEIAGDKSLAIFGSGYSGGMTALQILLIGQIIAASTGPVTYLMVATGEQNLAAIAQAVSTALFFISAIPLTAAWGMVGTAVAVTLARSTINIWMMIAAQRRIHIRSFVI
jgi:O-antigen/teichoic acid export membrane protein